MGRIDEIIAQKKLKPSDCLYHTWRNCLNKKGKPTGKIRVLVPKSDKTARVEYTCPECSHQGYAEAAWKKPFFVRCDKCSFKLSVPKMKDQFKREMKAESRNSGA